MRRGLFGAIQTLLSNLNYSLIFEGRLKHDVLTKSGLSQQQQILLQQDKMLLCQVAEVFMNAFKFGHQIRAEGSGYAFQRDHYVQGMGAYRCRASYVLYSSQYHIIYAVNSLFANAMRAKFLVEAPSPRDVKAGITTLIYKEAL